MSRALPGLQLHIHTSSHIPHFHTPHSAVKSMVYNAGRVWCGCDGGQIVVYSLADGALVKTIKAHSDTVDTLTVVGNQVMGVGGEYEHRGGGVDTGVGGTCGHVGGLSAAS